MEVQARRNWSREIFRAKENGVQYMCDLCDRKTPYEDIHRTVKHVYLCPCCHQHLSAMCEGKIKDNTIRFLMRNVI